MFFAIEQSVHKGESLLVLLRFLSIELLLQPKLLLLVLVLIQSRVNMHPTRSHCSNSPPQIVDLQEMHCAVQSVELFVVQLANSCC